MTQKRSIIFWNVERLFETTSSPILTALDPADRQISEIQVDEKIDSIAAVLSDIGLKAGPPLVIGIVEVQTPRLALKIAQAVKGVELEHIDAGAPDIFDQSLDAINITLLYDKNTFEKIDKVQSHIVDKTFETRDILEVKFSKTNERAPLTVFVSHWPSRLSAEGESKRIAAAYYLRSLVSEVVRFPLKKLWNTATHSIKLPNAKALKQKAASAAIVMGDFNDEPFNESLEIMRTTADLSAVANDLKVKGRKVIERFRSYIASVPYLANPFWHFADGDLGTYYRSPRWRVYDQIMFTQGFLTNETRTPSFIPGEAHIYNPKRVTRPDGIEIALTKRTGKPKSFNPATGDGCSDHFCIYTSVQW